MWTDPVLSGSVPSARKGASAACTQNRFVVVFGGKSVDADSKDFLAEDLLLLEAEGPATIKVSTLDIKGRKPPPRVNAMFQVSQYPDWPVLVLVFFLSQGYFHHVKLLMHSLASVTACLNHA